MTWHTHRIMSNNNDSVDVIQLVKIVSVKCATYKNQNGSDQQRKLLPKIEKEKGGDKLHGNKPTRRLYLYQ